MALTNPFLGRIEASSHLQIIYKIDKDDLNEIIEIKNHKFLKYYNLGEKFKHGIPPIYAYVYIYTFDSMNQDSPIYISLLLV